MRIIIFLSALLPLCSFHANAQAVDINDSLNIQFEPKGGFYAGQQQLYLSAPAATDIYYTLDGSKPGAKTSKRYIGPIFMDETTLIRAVAYDNDKPGLPCGQSYFLEEQTSRLPTVSIGIHPSILFHPSKGIFVQGNNAVDSLWHKPGANFWTRREYSVHIDMFEADGQLVYSNLSGLRLFGGMSRLFSQKSLSIVARKQYGQKRFNHNFFTKNDPRKYKFLILRNSGSDFGKSHFRDGLMTSLVQDWDMETQAFRPAQVYINGTYWGIYNIREKVNRFFIEDHMQDIKRDSIDLLEHYTVRKRGHGFHYREMLDFLGRYDLDIPSNYEHLHQYMEVDNFMQLQIAQIYFDNQDAGGNIKYWRPQTPDGRWRWVLYDTDWGMGLHSKEAYRNNSLRFHTNPAGPHWPNPPWSTYLLRKLLRNPDFQQQFIIRFSDHLNTTFKEERVAHFVDSFYLAIQYDMPRHLKRWRLSEKTWKEHIDRMRVFANKRPFYMRKQLKKTFHTGDDRNIVIETTTGGTVLLNDYIKTGRYFTGVYFEKLPISLKALPNYGYRFVRWQGDIETPSERAFSIDLTKDKDYHFKAVFESFTHHLTDQIIINEVCAKSKQTGDWVEIHNRSEEIVSLNGWILTDLRNEFIFPDIVLLPQDYLVVCKNVSRFRKANPRAYNVIGGLGFGINKRKETLCLYARQGASVDSLSYDIPFMDTSFTLSLSLPELDNADPENWRIRIGSGTPNAPNPYFVESRIRGQQSQWMQIGLATAVFLLSLFLLWMRRQER